VTVGASCGAERITEDVPAGALALGRARQVVKEGWAEARKKAAAVAPAPSHGRKT
jgi:bifunctional UDP-N-acetylglucosamine pyrophosphorylase/glucosamine-1-phosphate N-acetyltransferase